MRAELLVLLIDRSQPIINPIVTIIMGISFRLNTINSGVDWIGMAHSIDEPIIIDIIDIIIIGATVEGFSLDVNKGK
jgi:hypothetical protein